MASSRLILGYWVACLSGHCFDPFVTPPPLPTNADPAPTARANLRKSMNWCFWSARGGCTDMLLHGWSRRWNWSC